MTTTTKSGHPACSRCHRALKDPVSVKLELGPVCRKKLGVAEPADEGMLPTDRGPGGVYGRLFQKGAPRPSYSFVLEEGFVLVDDLSARTGGVTVTNAAEKVVAELALKVPLAGRRIVYRDTNGRWDELVHQGGRFVGFRAIGARSAHDAVHYAGKGLAVVDEDAFPGDPILGGTVELRPALAKPTSDG